MQIWDYRVTHVDWAYRNKSENFSDNLPMITTKLNLTTTPNRVIINIYLAVKFTFSFFQND